MKISFPKLGRCTRGLFWSSQSWDSAPEVYFGFPKVGTLRPRSILVFPKLGRCTRGLFWSSQSWDSASEFYFGFPKVGTVRPSSILAFPKLGRCTRGLILIFPKLGRCARVLFWLSQSWDVALGVYFGLPKVGTLRPRPILLFRNADFRIT